MSVAPRSKESVPIPYRHVVPTGLPEKIGVELATDISSLTGFFKEKAFYWSFSRSQIVHPHGIL